MLFVVGLLIVGLFIAAQAMTWIREKVRPTTAAEVADTLERFVQGTSNEWEWDDFLTHPLGDPRLEQIRLRCAQLDEEFPTNDQCYCNEQGVDVIRGFISQLRSL